MSAGNATQRSYWPNTYLFKLFFELLFLNGEPDRGRTCDNLIKS